MNIDALIAERCKVAGVEGRPGKTYVLLANHVGVTSPEATFDSGNDHEDDSRNEHGLGKMEYRSNQLTEIGRLRTARMASTTSASHLHFEVVSTWGDD